MDAHREAEAIYERSQSGCYRDPDWWMLPLGLLAIADAINNLADAHREGGEQ